MLYHCSDDRLFEDWKKYSWKDWESSGAPWPLRFWMRPRREWRNSRAACRRRARFWRLAAEGRTFYTVTGDHWNCPIGSYTHNAPLPPEREPELMQTLSLMGDLGYVRMEEIPGVFRLPKTPAVVVYGPLGGIPWSRVWCCFPDGRAASCGSPKRPSARA